MENVRNNWSEAYTSVTDRNIGLVTEEQQERLRRARAAVLGVGGIGATVFEVLVRCGVGRFSIVDNDRIEASNMNRHVFASPETVGRMKTEVAAEWAARVSPDAEVAVFDRLDEGNIAEILEGADVAVMAIDTLAPCIVASRQARKTGIPLVEGWAIPCMNVRVFTSETPTLEEAYQLPTVGRAVADVPEEELRQLGMQVLTGLGAIEGVPERYSQEAIDSILRGRIPSFAPFVRLTAVAMAAEAIKVLLGWGQIALAPDLALYDPLKQAVPAVRPLSRTP